MNSLNRTRTHFQLWVSLKTEGVTTTKKSQKNRKKSRKIKKNQEKSKKSEKIKKNQKNQKKSRKIRKIRKNQEKS